MGVTFGVDTTRQKGHNKLSLWASSVQRPWMGLSQEDDDGAFKAHVTRLNNATVGEVIYTTSIDGS